MRFNYGASIANIMLVFTLIMSAFYLRLYKEGE
jgi:ABC-type sugar transport system permease subunit